MRDTIRKGDRLERDLRDVRAQLNDALKKAQALRQAGDALAREARWSTESSAWERALDDWATAASRLRP